MGSDNTAFHDIPESSYPFTVSFYNELDGSLLHEIEVTGPGLVGVPSFYPTPVSVLTIMHDGTIVAASSKQEVTIYPPGEIPLDAIKEI